MRLTKWQKLVTLLLPVQNFSTEKEITMATKKPAKKKTKKTTASKKSC